MPSAPQSLSALHPVLKSIDIHGSARIDLAWITAQLGDKLQRLAAADDYAEPRRVKTDIIDAISARYADVG